jgi:transposase, IS30 family
VAGFRLSAEERVRIEVLWAEGLSIPQIADRLDRHRSTVWREVERNNSYRHGPKHGERITGPGGDVHGSGRRGSRRGVYRWGYSARRAQRAARVRARRPRPVKCGRGSPIRAVVLDRLRRRWSPQQIAAWLREQFPAQPELWVSHETIYQALYLQGRGNLRAELARQVALRSGRTERRRQKRVAGATRSARAWITEQFHISARPAEAADRAVPGHWEGDLLIGARGSSAIITLVERSTRFAMLGALPDGRTSEAVIDVLSGLAQQLPEQLRRSLAWDCGAELADHPRFTVVTGCPVYFCDPHSPWQRGSNENTNGLLRQYFPKGKTDFRRISQHHLDTVATELNARPRMTLGWQTPAQALQQLLVATTT